MTSPFVRRHQLATELRTLREQSGMTADDLAQRIYRSRMTISKLENARTRPDTYADLESGAATIRGYNQMSIPGLVQLPEFVQALIDLDLAEGSAINYVPERTVQARLERQRTFFRRDEVKAEIVLDEFVLKRLAVPTLTMAAQLRHMIDVISHQPHFTLLILPLNARLSPGRLPPSTYMIYTFPDPADQAMVVAENANTDLIHTEPEEVAKYERLHDRLREATLPALESLSLLADTADRLIEQAGHDK